MAVPSSMSPRFTRSVLVFCKRLSNDAWSVVIGHWVNASPANIVRPMLSLGRSEMNDEATFFAASMRFGFRSSASMDVDISMASMMSMPSTVRSSHALRVCGRQSTITSSASVIHLKAMGVQTSLWRNVFGASFSNHVSLRVIVGSDFFLNWKYHTRYGISRSRSRKYSLFANSMFVFFLSPCHCIF